MMPFAPSTQPCKAAVRGPACGAVAGVAAGVAAGIAAEGATESAAGVATTSAADTAVLLARLATGDQAALATLYQREAAPVYRYALALCGNPGWAADAVQEAFVALAARPGGFDASRGAIGAYLAGIARHSLAALWRGARLEEPWPMHGDGSADEGAGDSHSGSMDSTFDGHAPSPETMLVRAQHNSAVWAALRQLPAPFRDALVLVDLQERPYAEAAGIAGIELNTLRTRVHRARQKLAALLGAPARSPR